MSESDRNVIDRQRAVWIAAINRASVDDFVGVLTDDAVWLPWRQAAISGKEGIRQWLIAPFGRYTYDYTVSAVSVRIAGDWAVERASFRTAARDRAGLEAPLHEGTYTLLWRRIAPDTWLIERYIDHTP